MTPILRALTTFVQRPSFSGAPCRPRSWHQLGSTFPSIEAARSRAAGSVACILITSRSRREASWASVSTRACDRRAVWLRGISLVFTYPASVRTA
jgi:hypothetical protein